MNSKLTISLKKIGDKQFSIDSIPVEGIDNFINILSSLKKMAEYLNEENTTIEFSEGSIMSSLVCSSQPLDNFIFDCGKIIKGRKSDNVELAKIIRELQTDLKINDISTDVKYFFGSKQKTVNLNQLFVESKTAKVSKLKYISETQLHIVSGTLNEIGGSVNTNYHFDYGNNDKIKISCTKSEAMTVNEYLYQYINVLVVRKKFINKLRNPEYKHVALLDRRLYEELNSFLSKYNNEENISSKLKEIYYLVRNSLNFEESYSVMIINILLIAFRSNGFHPSELKTVLIVSKPFEKYPIIAENRTLLADELEKMLKKN